MEESDIGIPASSQKPELNHGAFTAECSGMARSQQKEALLTEL